METKGQKSLGFIVYCLWFVVCGLWLGDAAASRSSQLTARSSKEKAPVKTRADIFHQNQLLLPTRVDAKKMILMLNSYSICPGDHKYFLCWVVLADINVAGALQAVQ
jgi:hypothetical protein